MLCLLSLIQVCRGGRAVFSIMADGEDDGGHAASAGLDDCRSVLGVPQRAGCRRRHVGPRAMRIDGRAATAYRSAVVVVGALLPAPAHPELKTPRAPSSSVAAAAVQPCGSCRSHRFPRPLPSPSQIAIACVASRLCMGLSRAAAGCTSTSHRPSSESHLHALLDRVRPALPCLAFPSLPCPALPCAAAPLARPLLFKYCYAPSPARRCSCVRPSPPSPLLYSTLSSFSLPFPALGFCAPGRDVTHCATLSVPPRLGRRPPSSSSRSTPLAGLRCATIRSAFAHLCEVCPAFRLPPAHRASNRRLAHMTCGRLSGS